MDLAYGDARGARRARPVSYTHLDVYKRQDLFETYAVTTVATMVLAAIFFSAAGGDVLLKMMTYPLAIGGVCIIASIIGTFFVKLGASQSIMGALYKGMIVTCLLYTSRCV